MEFIKTNFFDGPVMGKYRYTFSYDYDGDTVFNTPSTYDPVSNRWFSEFGYTYCTERGLSLAFDGDDMDMYWFWQKHPKDHPFFVVSSGCMTCASGIYWLFFFQCSNDCFEIFCAHCVVQCLPPVGIAISACIHQFDHQRQKWDVAGPAEFNPVGHDSTIDAVQVSTVNHTSDGNRGFFC